MRLQNLMIFGTYKSQFIFITAHRVKLHKATSSATKIFHRWKRNKAKQSKVKLGEGCSLYVKGRWWWWWCDEALHPQISATDRHVTCLRRDVDLTSRCSVAVSQRTPRTSVQHTYLCMLWYQYVWSMQITPTVAYFTAKVVRRYNFVY